MYLPLILAFSWVLMPSVAALAARQPQASPVCAYTCNGTPPSTSPGGEYLGQTTNANGPHIECDYFTTDLYSTGPTDYSCLYTFARVPFNADTTYCLYLQEAWCRGSERFAEGGKREAQKRMCQHPVFP